MKRRVRLQSSVLALQPKAGEAQLLAHQWPTGNWGGPKEDRGLLITLYSLVVLMDLGLDPASEPARKMIERVDKQLIFKSLNNRPFLDGETETCINGRILAIGAYFGKPDDLLANRLLGQQLDDGGWNCEAIEPSAKRPPSRRSSFHTTICVLEGKPGSRVREAVEIVIKRRHQNGSWAAQPASSRARSIGNGNRRR